MSVLETMIAQQKAKVLECAQTLLPQCTTEDVLQPQDFPALEANAAFRYEEGILAGLEMAKIALGEHACPP